MNAPTTTTGTVQVSARIPPTVAAQLDQLAHGLGWSRGKLLEFAIDQLLSAPTTAPKD